MYVVEDYWLSVAWRLRQPHISWDYRLKYLSAKEAAQVGGDLLRESCAVVVHG